MGLWKRLYEFYNFKQEYEKNALLRPFPIGFMSQRVHIDLRIGRDGKCAGAEVVSDKTPIPMPATPKSQARTSAPVAHLLFDTMEYLAKDLADYTPPSVKESQRNKMRVKYSLKKEVLSNWIEYLSELQESASYDSGKVLSYLKKIRDYLENEDMVKDLVRFGVLFLDDDGKLTELNESGEKSELAKTATNIYSAFIHIKVDGVENGDCMERDSDYIEATKDYILTKLLTPKGIDYITGEEQSISDLHQKRLRNGGDGAKLISSNDSTNYTYRGRFRSSEEALTIGYESSEKAHNALRYLIDTQGYSQNGRTFLVFGTKTIALQEIHTIFRVWEDESETTDEKVAYDTYKRQSQEVIKALKGRKAEIGEDFETVVVAILDSATPGRLALLYYQELDRADWLDLLILWQQEAAWEWRVKTKEGNYLLVSQAPAPWELITACYGMNVDDNLKKSAYERIFRTIINGELIPADMRKTLLHRASNPQGLEFWERSQIMSCACGAFRQYYKRTEGKDYDMALDLENRDRDYLFGRLLALAESLENDAIWYSTGESNKRGTNAQRRMASFRQNPYRAWVAIYNQLLPYRTILNKRGKTYYDDEINEVIDAFQPGDFEKHKALEGKYLLGYSSQMIAIRDRKKAAKEAKETKATKETAE